jgi:hypothetical protein
MQTQTANLNESQIKQLCDEVATALINILESQNVDAKIEATVNNFLSTNNLNSNTSDLLNRMLWSVKVSLRN